MATKFEIYKENWLHGIELEGQNYITRGLNFARKLLQEYLDSNYNENAQNFAGSNKEKGSIDFAYLHQKDENEENGPEGDTWYIVLTEYGRAFENATTLINECREIISALCSNIRSLSSVSDVNLQILQNFKQIKMYFCYVDESGDCGEYSLENPENSGSKYFILSGVIVSSSKWKQSLNAMKSFRRDIAAKAYLPYDIEFHCAEMIDPHKINEFRQISRKDRWMLIEQYAHVISNNAGLQIISVVLDKHKSNLANVNYLTEAITKLYQAFDEYLKLYKEEGILFFDRANERTVTTHVRKLMGTGSSGTTVPGVRIGWIIEDPIFRISADSIFVQAADIVAYTLKEREFPNGTRKKFNADRIFDNKLAKTVFIHHYQTVVE